MPIPDYETLMLPLLKIIADGKEHEPLELTESLADQFKLTSVERKQVDVDYFGGE